MIDTTNITTESLEAFDDMMIECVWKVGKFAPLAVSVWAEVLRELDIRGRVRLISGSYADLGNARIERKTEARSS